MIIVTVVIIDDGNNSKRDREYVYKEIGINSLHLIHLMSISV